MVVPVSGDGGGVGSQRIVLVMLVFFLIYDCKMFLGFSKSLDIKPTISYETGLHYTS